MNINDYLKRIKSENYCNVSLENLQKLQKNHLLNIPFENLDLMRNIKTKINIEKFYNKIINENRGGFCFELNMSFAWLLSQLGYENRIVAARVFSANPNYIPRWSHVAIIVKLNGIEYLVDAGLSSCFRCPVELIPEHVQTDLIGRLKISPADLKETANIENCFNLYRCSTSDQTEWTRMYQFQTGASKMTDFEEVIEWVQSPGCPRFFNRSICVIHGEDHVLILVGFRLTKVEYTDGVETNRLDTILNSKEEVYQNIRTLFNLSGFNEEFEPIDIPL